MTLGELYLDGLRQLTSAGVNDPPFEAGILLEAIFSISGETRRLEKNRVADEKKVHAYKAALLERVAKRPLQYILGEWPFFDLSLCVGEGVLIPRDDTEVLVRTAETLLQGVKAPVGLDLCAGSGAVGLGLCSRLPTASITAVELSDKAFPFLLENCRRYPQLCVTPVKGDILLPETAQKLARPLGYDVLLSNPPYICHDILSSLQAEVQKEPCMALDGGEDGLLFYRALATLWLPLLCKGGLLAVEIGEDQPDAVCEIFKSHGVGEVTVHPDLVGLPRVVTGRVFSAN